VHLAEGDLVTTDPLVRRLCHEDSTRSARRWATSSSIARAGSEESRELFEAVALTETVVEFLTIPPANTSTEAITGTKGVLDTLFAVWASWVMRFLMLSRL